jgi:hypothetical protein
LEYITGEADASKNFICEGINRLYKFWLQSTPAL